MIDTVSDKPSEQGTALTRQTGASGPPVRLEDILAGLSSVHTVCRQLAAIVTEASDENLRQLDAEARALEGSAWLVEVATDYEAYKRIKRRMGTDDGERAKQNQACRVRDLMAEEAALRHKSPALMWQHVQVYETFFLGPHSVDTTRLLDKSHYVSALRSPDPHAAIEFLTSRKDELSSLSVRQARLELAAQNGTTSPDIASPGIPQTSTALQLSSHEATAVSTEKPLFTKRPEILKQSVSLLLVKFKDGPAEADLKGLALFANDCLTPNGTLIVIQSPLSLGLGQACLKTAQFTLRWVFSVRMANKAAGVPEGIHGGWQAALWYTRPTYRWAKSYTLADNYPGVKQFAVAIVPSLTDHEGTVVGAGVPLPELAAVAEAIKRPFVQVAYQSQS